MTVAIHTRRGFGAALLIALSIAGAYPVAGAASEPLAASGQNLSLDAPTARIYRSVGKDGSVVFTDQPRAGAASMQVRTYSSSSEPAAIERAEREREYWRRQSEAFALRQRERERELAEDRRLSSLSSQPYYADPAPPFYVSPYWGWSGARPCLAEQHLYSGQARYQTCSLQWSPARRHAR